MMVSDMAFLRVVFSWSSGTELNNIPGKREKFDRKGVPAAYPKSRGTAVAVTVFQDKLRNCAEAHRSAWQLTSPA